MKEKEVESKSLKKGKLKWIIHIRVFGFDFVTDYVTDLDTNRD